jgi:hypothetical protein
VAIDDLPGCCAVWPSITPAIADGTERLQQLRRFPLRQSQASEQAGLDGIQDQGKSRGSGENGSAA